MINFETVQMINFINVFLFISILALRRIANLASINNCDNDTLKGIAEAANGDLRSAVNTLQFFSNRVCRKKSHTRFESVCNSSSDNSMALLSYYLII